MRRSLPLIPEVIPEAPAVAVERPRAVRLSITDRCDMACVYCRTRGGRRPSAPRLAPPAWELLVRALVEVGIRRVRITGGEPLVHPEVLDIVERVASVPGIDDVALTTNGSRLAGLAAQLHARGLRRVNVSLDTLEAARFFRLTRGGQLSAVLAGLDAAAATSLEVKTNTVVLAGENEDELESIVRRVWSIGGTPRFLELMSVGEGASREGVGAPAMRARLSHLLEEGEARVDADRGPARYVRERSGRRRVGFITGATSSFCAGCDRLRVGSDGRLRPCLATNEAVDVSEALRHGDLAAVVERAASAWRRKPVGPDWRGCGEPSALGVDMSTIGG